MENPYEDLTVNQQQAQFQAQQQAQQRADILGGLRETAGGAGVAGLAQAMASQSALGAQRISASIGQQEAMNERLRAQGAMQVQKLEAAGEEMVSRREQQRMETLYGMDMSRVTAANQATQAARQQMIGCIGQGLCTMAMGMAMGETPFGGGGGGVSSNLRLGMQGKMDASLGGSFQSPQLSLGSDQLIADKFNQPVPDFFGDRLRFGGTFRYS